MNVLRDMDLHFSHMKGLLITAIEDKGLQYLIMNVVPKRLGFLQQKLWRTSKKLITWSPSWAQQLCKARYEVINFEKYIELFVSHHQSNWNYPLPVNGYLTSLLRKEWKIKLNMEVNCNNLIILWILEFVIKPLIRRDSILMITHSIGSSAERYQEMNWSSLAFPFTPKG